MSRTSRIVTNLDGIEVLEVTQEDAEGNWVRTDYFVLGQKYDSLKGAMEAARAMVREQEQSSS
ncbi:MAG: hypothetical protein A4E57_01915 [Syntrophorhabdaceae bacterium PtaU1.Bin034]|jgi:hypothetical protein|nr:MAG: hypothetical protein A4E57_01915 [Syntrophorhabdaceae bacterium PtaU1.Bin034]